MGYDTAPVARSARSAVRSCRWPRSMLVPVLLVPVLVLSSAPDPEVLVFHWDAEGAYPGGHRDPSAADRHYVGSNASAWRSYNWSVVTTVVTFTFGGTVDPELLRTAHMHGSKVVIGAAAQNSPLWSGAQALNSSTHRTALAEDVVANVRRQGADGINLDIEWPPIGIRDSLTAFTCELSALLRREVPGAHVSFDMPARPVLYEPGTRAYDFAALALCLDYMVVMDYDMATPDQLKANISAPNSPLPGIRRGMAEFVSLGVPIHQLVLAMPWVGMVYPCLGLDAAKEGPSGCIPWPPWIDDPDNCTIETGFGTIQETLLPLSAAGRQWDQASSSPWFDYIDHTTTPPKRHRVWYDDAESSRAKTSLSVELGLAGVGVWVGNALGRYAIGAVGQQMWQSLRGQLHPPPSPPGPARREPVFHPPVLVSDSPFNDYADGYYLIPRRGRISNNISNTYRLGSATSGDDDGGVIFGIGAGRFTQSSSLGASWVALPQWDGNAADTDGYNPAAPFSGPLFGLLTPTGTLRDWGHINYGDQNGRKPNVSYANFHCRVGNEFFINETGWVSHRVPIDAPNLTLGPLPHPVQCPSWYFPKSCPFWIGSGAGGDTVLLNDNVTALQTTVVTYLNGHTLNPPEACGIFVFRSTDTPRYRTWTYIGTVATEADFPGAGEGPNEHGITLLADGSTLTVVFRLDNGDGNPLHPLQAKQSPYHQSFSTDSGESWSTPKPMVSADGTPMGCARPRLHLLTPTGPLLLVGGRNVVGKRGDAILWVNENGDGHKWVEYSLSGRHNALLPPARESWAFSPMVNLSDYRETNGYSAIVPIAPRSVIVTYNRGPKNGAASHRGPYAINATCQVAIDRLCNGTGYAVYPEVTAVTEAVKAKGAALPLVGRFSDAATQPHGGGAKAWRCYSPDALDSATGEYNHKPSSAGLYLKDVRMIGAVQEAIFRCDGCNAYGVCDRNQGPVGDKQHGWSNGVEEMGDAASTLHDNEWGRPLVFSMRIDF